MTILNRDFKNPATTTISFALNDERVFTLLQEQPSRITLSIMPANDNLCFTLRSDDYIITDGVDYKSVSTMQAAINRALRWKCIKVKLVIKTAAMLMPPVPAWSNFCKQMGCVDQS